MASATVGLLRVLLTMDTAEFDSAMKRVSSSAGAWSKDLGRMGQQATQLGASLTKTLTVPILGLGAGAAKLAMDFESSFAGVRKTVDGVVDKFGNLTAAGKEIQQGLRDMAKEIPVTVTELTAIAESAGQMNIPKENLLEFTRVMADLGVTTNLTSEQAATAVGNIQNIFGAAGKDVDRFGATLVALGNNGASTEKDIVEMSLRIAGAGRTVGLSQAQVLGFANALASVGINAEAGGSAISRTFLKINDAVASGGPKLDEFARVAGVTAQAFKESFEKDAAGATVSFIEGLKRLKNSGENINATLDDLVGKNIIIKDTLLRASGAGDLLRDSISLANQAWKDNTALVNEARERYKTTESQLKTLWNQIKDVGITLGNALLPTINLTIQAMSNLIPVVDTLAKGFNAMPTAMQAIIVGLGLTVAAIGPLIYGLGQLLIAASAVSGAFAAKGLAVKGLIPLITGLGNTVPVLTARIWLMQASVASLSAAFGALAVVAASGFAVFKASSEAWKLYQERTERATMATNEAARQQQYLAEASKIAGRQITDLAEAKRIVIERARELADAQQKAAQEVKQAAAVQVTAQRSLSDQLAATNKQIASLTTEQRANIVAGDKMGLSAKEIAEALNKQWPALKITEESVKLYTQRLDQNAAAAERATKAQTKFLESVRSLANIFVPLVQGMSDAGQELQNIARGFAGDGTLLNQTIHESAEAAAAADEELRKWAQTTGAVLAPAMLNFRGVLAGVTKDTVTWAETIAVSIGRIPELVRQAFTGGGGLSGSFNAMFSDLGSGLIGKLFEAGGALNPLLNKLVGGVSNLFGKTIGDALGMALPGIGQAIGALLGPLLGKLGGWLKGLFGVSEEVQKARQDLEALQKTLADTATEAQKAEAGGRDWALMIIRARDAMIGLGMSAAEADQAAQRLVGRALNTDNYEDSARAIAELNELLGEHEAHLKLQEEQLRRNKEEAGNLYDELMSLASEAGGIPAGMRDLIEQFASLGLLTDEQVEKLRGLGDSGAMSLDKMQKAADVFKARLESLGPAFNQERLNQDAMKMANALDVLIKGGADVGGVLFDAKEEISDLVNQSLKFKTTVPANMKPWIEHLFEAGLLVDENGEKLTDLSQLKYGEPLKTEAEKIQDAFKKMTDKLIEFFDRIARGIDNIPDRRIKVGVDWDPGDAPITVPEPLPGESRPMDQFRGFDTGALTPVSASALGNALSVSQPSMALADTSAGAQREQATSQSFVRAVGELMDRRDQIFLIAVRDAVRGAV